MPRELPGPRKNIRRFRVNDDGTRERCAGSFARSSSEMQSSDRFERMRKAHTGHALGTTPHMAISVSSFRFDSCASPDLNRRRIRTRIQHQSLGKLQHADFRRKSLRVFPIVCIQFVKNGPSKILYK